MFRRALIRRPYREHQNIRLYLFAPQVFSPRYASKSNIGGRHEGLDEAAGS